MALPKSPHQGTMSGLRICCRNTADECDLHWFVKTHAYVVPWYVDVRHGICSFRWHLMFPLSQNPNVYVHSASCYGMLWLDVGHMIPNVEQITNYPRCSASVLVLVIHSHWCWPEPHRPAPQRVQLLAVSSHLESKRNWCLTRWSFMKFQRVQTRLHQRYQSFQGLVSVPGKYSLSSRDLEMSVTTDLLWASSFITAVAAIARRSVITNPRGTKNWTEQNCRLAQEAPRNAPTEQAMRADLTWDKTSASQFHTRLTTFEQGDLTISGTQRHIRQTSLLKLDSSLLLTNELPQSSHLASFLSRCCSCWNDPMAVSEKETRLKKRCF